MRTAKTCLTLCQFLLASLVFTAGLFSAAAQAQVSNKMLDQLSHYDWKLHSIQSGNTAPRTLSRLGFPLSHLRLAIHPVYGGFQVEAPSLCPPAPKNFELGGLSLPELQLPGKMFSANFLPDQRIANVKLDQVACQNGVPGGCLQAPLCSDPVKNQAETEYHNYLGQMSRFQQQKHLLTLFTRAGDTLTFNGQANENFHHAQQREALAKQPKPGLDKLMVWPKWQLVSIRQSDQKVLRTLRNGLAFDDIYLRFHNEQGIAYFSFSGFCNGTSGSLKLDYPDKISMTNVESTTKGCYPAKLVQGDDEISRYFTSAYRYQINGNQLQLVTDKGDTLYLQGAR